MSQDDKNGALADEIERLIAKPPVNLVCLSDGQWSAVVEALRAPRSAERATEAFNYIAKEGLKRADEADALRAAASSARPSVPPAIRAALLSLDLYQVLLDVQNGIDSPGLISIANSAIRTLDKGRAELYAQEVAPASAIRSPLPKGMLEEAERVQRLTTAQKYNWNIPGEFFDRYGEALLKLLREAEGRDA